MKIHEKWRTNQLVSTLYIIANCGLLKGRIFAQLANKIWISQYYFRENSESLNRLHSILSTLPGPFGDIIWPRDSSDLSTLGSATPFDRESTHGGSSSNPRSGSLTRSSTTDKSLEDTESSNSLGALSWLSLLDTKATNAISSSPKGTVFDYLGCFPHGFNVTRKSFVDVVHSQQRLKDMNLLDEIKHPRLMEIGRKLQRFYDTLSAHDTRHTTEWLAAMQELAQNLSSLNSNSISPIHAYIGLDSGFQIHPGNRF